MLSWSNARWFHISAFSLLLSLAGGSAQAQFSNSGRLLTEVGGKLPLTRGITTAAGAAGGALTPWAVIAGNGLDRGIGATGHFSYVPVKDYTLRSFGVGVGLYDRVELSYTRNSFDTRDAGALLGLGQGFEFHQDIIGAKVRLAGDAVYDQDLWMPQIAAGIQYKNADRADLVRALGAADDDGFDLYLSATKILLEHSLLVNATLRLTKAHQTGLLGFSDDWSVQPEFSVAYLLTRRLAVGAEYRFKPDQLAFAQEDNWLDAFAAYAVTDNVTVVAAYAALGRIATLDNQNGAYIALQVGF